MAIADELPIDSTATAEEMAAEIFGDGILINEAEYFGDAGSSGIYTDGDNVSPFATPGDSGVILSTGLVESFTNGGGGTDTNLSASTSTNTDGGIDGDADFDNLANASTFDASILTVKFVPSGDKITIDFVLSSEEYPEYINSAFNDVVGVWVNDVPATVTVGDGSASVGNINGGATQDIYFDNTNDDYNTEMDGFTVTLTFVAPVNPGAENTIKIGVADVADSLYDTNLLIAGGSVQSTIVAQDDEVTLNGNESQVVDVLANDSSTGGTLTVTHINGQMVEAGDEVELASGQTIMLNNDGTFTITGDGDDETVYFNYSVVDEALNTDTALVEIVQVPCFGQGTRIDTPNGAVAIETLQPGDMITVRDGGTAQLKWVGQRTVAATGVNRPIRLKAGMLRAREDLLLSPQHRVLLADRWAELMFGEPEVLIRAKDLVDDHMVRFASDLKEITYFHLLFDKHQIVTANGVAAESYLPGPMTLSGFDAPTQQELLALFPELESESFGYGPAARPLLRAREAAPLLAMIAA